jgi:hypothetical protein
MARFQVELQVAEGKTPLVSILGDVEAPGWESQLMRGIDELLELIADMYGKDVVQKGLERHFK